MKENGGQFNNKKYAYICLDTCTKFHIETPEDKEYTFTKKIQTAQRLSAHPVNMQLYILSLFNALCNPFLHQFFPTRFFLFHSLFPNCTLLFLSPVSFGSPSVILPHDCNLSSNELMEIFDKEKYVLSAVLRSAYLNIAFWAMTSWWKSRTSRSMMKQHIRFNQRRAVRLFASSA